MIIAGLAVAGALGAVLRHLVDRLVQRRIRSGIPLGILAVNLTGSLVLGVLVASGLRHGIPTAWVTVAGTGLIGSYTTFSTFAFDTVRLMEADRRAASLLNVVVSITAGIGAAAAGLAVGSLT
ncbi:MAG TPA: fluoride efflux transporter CrcB [Acidimicrobiales bacterium]|nr:fluoride efflux transporter CrcB [Acidimicrobiales bacterium]